MAGRHKQWRGRCAVCGEFLFARGQHCSRHPGQMVIEWTGEMAQAYRVQADLIRDGREPVKLSGLVGNRYEVAARYVRLWEQREGAA
jgi:hypothetical protein